MKGVRAQISRVRKVNSRFSTGYLLSLLIGLLALAASSRLIFVRNISLSCLSKIARLKNDDNLLFFAGLKHFTNGKAHEANYLFTCVSKLDELAPRALHFIARCASWISDSYNLYRIQSQLGPTSSIGIYSGALISHKDDSEASIKSFGLVERAFLQEQLNPIAVEFYPEYVKTSMNVVELEKVDKSNLDYPEVKTPIISKQLQNSNTPEIDIQRLIVVSVTLDYLSELAGILISRIRSRHNHPIVLIVVVSDYLEIRIATELLLSLSKNRLHIYWEIYTTQFNAQNVSSVARFVVAQKFFDKNQCESILILDADTSLRKSDPIRIWDEIGIQFAVGLITHESLSPWERLSLGWTILNRGEFTTNFLLSFSKYVHNSFLRGKAFWTIDQTAAFIVLSDLQLNLEKIAMENARVLDLSKFSTLSDLTYLDRAMKKGKMKAKMMNTSFRQELSEPLFFD